MFSKNRSQAGNAAAADGASGSGVPSIISPDLKITGDLKSSGDIQVDGVVEGDVDAANLTVGESGAIHGRVTARTVRICGSIHGEVDAGTVTLAASAKMLGDILHDSLSIDAGAHMDGHCRRRPAQPAVQAKPAAAAAAAPAPARTTGDRTAGDRGSETEAPPARKSRSKANGGATGGDSAANGSGTSDEITVPSSGQSKSSLS